MSWRTDPAAALREGKITDLTIAEKDALDAGADLGQVINAKKTGKFGSMQQMRVEDVYAEAATHAEAIDLLKAYGFIL